MPGKNGHLPLIAIAILIVTGCSEQHDPRLAEANKRIEEFEEQIAQMQTQENVAPAETNKRIEELEALIAQMQKQENVATAEANKRIEELEALIAQMQKQENVATAEANRRFEQLEVLKAQMQKQKVALAAKPQPAAKTVKELSMLLRGIKTTSEVKALFGMPDDTSDRDEVWIYENRVIHSVTGKVEDLHVVFTTDGYLYKCRAGYSGKLWRP